MKAPVKIDFVSDITCGWCAVGLHALEQALKNLEADVEAELHLQPFELNPNMSADRQNLDEHMQYKYGPQAGEQYIAGTHERGASVGFKFNLDSNSRIYNTFDAHRLLHWAGIKGRQEELNHALFTAHFTENEDPGNFQVLLKCAAAAHLDPAEAEQILQSGAYAAEVKEREKIWIQKGVHAVPTVIINDQYAITGSRSVASFEELIRMALDIDTHSEDR